MPVPCGSIGATDPLVPYLLQERLHPSRLNGLEGHPVEPRGTIVFFGQSIGFVQRFPFTDMDE
jgi:hypothetical protein